jgi:hypothetical protein
MISLAKDPEENHGEPFYFVGIEELLWKVENVLTRSAIREPLPENNIMNCHRITCPI